MLFNLSSKVKIEVEALVLEPVIILKTIHILCYWPFAAYGDFSYFKSLCISRKPHWPLVAHTLFTQPIPQTALPGHRAPETGVLPDVLVSLDQQSSNFGIKAPSHRKWRMPESFCLCRLYLPMFTLFNSQFREILIIYVNNNTLDFFHTFPVSDKWPPDPLVSASPVKSASRPLGSQSSHSGNVSLSPFPLLKSISVCPLLLLSYRRMSVDNGQL